MISWSPEFIDGHCSSWSIVQMLEWLNSCSTTWLTSRRGWRFHLEKEAALLPDSRVDHSLVDQVEIREVARLLSQKHRWLPFASLRYCPVCISCGMHYGYQQDEQFRHCIVHITPLQTGCPTCGGDIDTKGRQCHGFVCTGCNCPIIRSAVPELRSPIRRRWDTFILDELTAWELDAERLHSGYQRPDTGQTIDLWGGLAEKGNAGLYWRALIANPNSRASAALAPPPTTFRLFPAVPLSNPIQCNSDYVAAEVILEPYELLLKAVSRHLRRTHLRGHGACCRYAITAVGRLGRGVSPEVDVHPHLCCLGQAYALWRLQWSHELKAMLEHLARGYIETRCNAVRLPSLGAAQLSLVSSFQQWVDILAQLQQAFRGSAETAILGGVGTRPYWALLQDGARYSCPIHFRHADLRAAGCCDRGETRRREIARRRAAVRSLGLGR